MAKVTGFLDGEAYNKQYPDQFWISDEEEKRGIKIGDEVKIIAEYEGMPSGTPDSPAGERLFVVVTARDGNLFAGRLVLTPRNVDLERGDVLRFEARHIIYVFEHPSGF